METNKDIKRESFEWNILFTKEFSTAEKYKKLRNVETELRNSFTKHFGTDKYKLTLSWRENNLGKRLYKLTGYVSELSGPIIIKPPFPAPPIEPDGMVIIGHIERESEDTIIDLSSI